MMYPFFIVKEISICLAFSLTETALRIRYSYPPHPSPANQVISPHGVIYEYVQSSMMLTN